MLKKKNQRIYLTEGFESSGLLVCKVYIGAAELAASSVQHKAKLICTCSYDAYIASLTTQAIAEKLDLKIIDTTGAIERIKYILDRNAVRDDDLSTVKLLFPDKTKKRRKKLKANG